MHRSRRTCRLVALACLLAGSLGACTSSHETGPLEIGYRDGSRVFHPYAPGDDAHIVMGGTAAQIVPVSLRYEGGSGVVSRVEVRMTLGGLVVGGNPIHALDTLPDGPRFVLPSADVWLTVEACCLTCARATIAADVQDANGLAFAGTVDVLVSRGGCPDPTACCPSADACPAPLVANVCP